MRRTANWLVGALALTALGVVDTSGQEVKNAPKKEPPKKAVTKVAPAAAVIRAVPNEATIAQFEQQYGQMVRQVFRSEMHFMRVVCEPTKAQFEAVTADTAADVKATPRKLAEAMLRGGGQFDPRETFTDAIGKSIRTILSADQAARYVKELELRAAARKRLVVVNLVASVDKALILSPDQREKLAAVLAANWNEAWNQTQMFMYGNQYLPQMPDAKILPILSDAQKTVWRSVPKANVRFGVNLGFMQVMEVDDEVWDYKPVPKAAPAAKAVEKR